MPIYEYKCEKCGNDYTILKSILDYKDSVMCDCGNWAKKVPSVPGYRRDHTRLER